MLDLHGGGQLASLAQGHYAAIGGCAWGAAAGELYTGGADGALLIWSCNRLHDELAECDESDAWSDEWAP